MGWPSVRGFQQGDQVVPSVLNTPLNQLAERTEHLLQLLQADSRTRSVCVKAVVADKGYGKPVVGQPVYRHPDGSGAYAVAAALTSENQWFYADPTAMAVGVCASRSGDTGATVVLCGLLDFGTTGISAADVIVDASPTSGRYYLSTTPGKLTADPVGPVIYVADVQIGANGNVLSMLVNPQYRDTGESHIHRAFRLSGLPMGGYAVQGASVYDVSYVWPTTETPTSSVKYPSMGLELLGSWSTDAVVTYTFTVEKINASGGEAWSNYRLVWSATTGETGGSVSGITMTSGVSDVLGVGSFGLKVRLRLRTTSVTPASLVGKEWQVAMPSAAQSWAYVSVTNSVATYRTNLGMYPALARYAPPNPANGAALILDGLEVRSPVFGTDKQWEIRDDDDDNENGGPWLYWYGGQVSGSSATTPFRWISDTTAAEDRGLVLHVNRMRVGPTGFVTSLQVAKGAPFKITSAQTAANAVQGALQIAMDTDFTTGEGNVPGFQVVKRIVGSEFQTGPVVERIVNGPGVEVSPGGGQGVVTVSISNAKYAGDFETIALKNAKQDLVGTVFPYTKLLGWSSQQGAANIASGFTAKFRVPDYLPYTDAAENPINYKVIVSASVFGEVQAATTAAAAFQLTNYVLADQACVAASSASFTGPIATPTPGASQVIPVTLFGPYTAFDPVLIHGFSTDDIPDVQGTRQAIGALELKQANGTSPVVVRPGYFVGLDISRCAPASGTNYASPIGFLSLRWNLVVA